MESSLLQKLHFFVISCFSLQFFVIRLGSKNQHFNPFILLKLQNYKNFDVIRIKRLKEKWLNDKYMYKKECPASVPGISILYSTYFYCMILNLA